MLVIWVFERSGRQLHFEIRPAPEGGEFELVWTDADGQQHIERSANATDLDERRRELEERLKLDGWTRVGRVTPQPGEKRFL
jgi:hypothetical protein